MRKKYDHNRNQAQNILVEYVYNAVVLHKMRGIAVIFFFFYVKMFFSLLVSY
jgi:hypothetical protein